MGVPQATHRKSSPLNKYKHHARRPLEGWHVLYSLRHPHSGVQIPSSCTQGCESSRFAWQDSYPGLLSGYPHSGVLVKVVIVISPLSCDRSGQPFGIIATSTYRTYG